MSVTSFTPAFGYDSVDDGWELDASAIDDGWTVANDETPRLELSDAEQAFFDEGDALVDQKVDTFEDLDPTPAAPARPPLWRRLFRRG